MYGLHRAEVFDAKTREKANVKHMRQKHTISDFL